MNSKLIWLLIGLLFGVILTLVMVFLLGSVHWPQLELEVLLQDQLVKVIVIPIMLAIFSVLVEQAPKLAKGWGQGRYKYKVWMRQPSSAGQKTFFSVDRQSFEDVVRMQRSVIDVEQMTSFSISEFSSVAINLIVSTFAVDIAAITNPSSEPINVAALLTIHLVLLAGVIIFLIAAQRAHPEDGKTRRNWTILAIILSFIAIMSAFGTM